MNVAQASTLLSELQHATAGQSVAWLQQARQQAFETLQRNGFPSKKSEDWKYTNVRPVLEADYRWQDMHCFGLMPEDIQHLFLPDADNHRMVFVNGRFAPQLSLLGDIGTGVQLQSPARALDEQPEQLRNHLTHYADSEVHGFAALNSAALTDGLYCHLAAGQRLRQPIHLIYLTTPSDKLLVLPRNLIWLEPASEATLIEHHASLGEGAALVDAVTEIRLQDQAVLNLFVLHAQNTSSTHIGCRYIQQDRGSRLSTTVVSIGGRLVRDDITTRLQGDAAECSLQGLYLASGNQQVDFHTCIEHVAKGCSSRQNYRGALDEHAHGLDPAMARKLLVRGYMQASLRSRDAFWDIPVTKTHSTFDSLIVPRPPCVHAASPHHRKLGAGYAGTPSMAGRHDRMRSLPPLWRASARRVGSIASWLPGTTRPRFALHGAQRLAG